MNKKIFLTFLFGILAVGIGLLAYWSMASPKGTEHSSASPLHSSEAVKKSGSKQNTNRNTSSSKQRVSQETKKENKTEEVKQERKAFNQTVLEQDYYLEKVDDKGNMTYIKATNEELEALEKKNKTEQFNVYQVEHDGQMISVLATSERN
uniref:hypothetical protein n=1 Tax=Lactococcus garvieae TaxID=1363 RepID=UPI00359C7CD2